MLHKRSFQSWAELEYALELLGIAKLAAELQDAYATSDFARVRFQLNNIVHRRNLIVHEGDLVRHERGGRVRKYEISRQYVEDSLNFLETLVAKLDTVNLRAYPGWMLDAVSSQGCWTSIQRP